MESTSVRHGLLYRFFAEDHRRLDGLFQRAVGCGDEIDRAAYAEFRQGLLKHISMEEKILLPFVQKICGGVPLPAAARLRLEHGAIAALLVPSPSPQIVAALRAILSAHNAFEEGEGGLYEVCGRLAGADVDDLLAHLRGAPEVAVAPHVDGPKIIEATRRPIFQLKRSDGRKKRRNCSPQI